MLTWIEINTSAIKHNIGQFRRLIGPKTLLMPVIKSNAYGHGFLEIAKLYNQNKEVDRLCVASLDEATILIKNKITKPIVILSFYDPLDKNCVQAIKRGVAFPLYTLEQAEKLSVTGKKADHTIKVHLKIDTGASRVGILPSEAVKFVETVQKKFPNIYFEGIWSHFSSSETNTKETKKQWKIFNQVIKKLESRGVRFSIKHMACSAATIMHPETQGNAVRIGLGLYGLKSSKTKLNLQPVLSWFTTVIQVKQVSAGVKIGYSGTYTTRQTTKLAVIPVGYFDGYDRRFSNRAKVTIKGVSCPIRGRICMNLAMVDVTKIKNIAAGDQVTLIGRGVTADELAKISNTINYEIVSRINPLLPRILV